MVLSRTFLSAALVLLLAVVQRCSAGIDEEQKEPWQINYLTLFGEKNSHFGQRIFFIFKDSNPGHEVEKICAHYSPPGGSVEDSTVLISCTQDAKQFFQQGQQPVRSQPGQADQPAEEVIFGFDGSSVEIFRIFTPHE